jgi:hypothetical protein
VYFPETVSIVALHSNVLGRSLLKISEAVQGSDRIVIRVIRSVVIRVIYPHTASDV